MSMSVDQPAGLVADDQRHVAPPTCLSCVPGSIVDCRTSRARLGHVLVDHQRFARAHDVGAESLSRERRWTSIVMPLPVLVDVRVVDQIRSCGS